MDEKETGLDRLSEIYEILDDKEKELVIKLAEGLLNCHNVFNTGKSDLEVKLENVNVWINFCIEVLMFNLSGGN